MVTYIIEANKGTRNFYYTEFTDVNGDYDEYSVKELYDKNTGLDTHISIKARSLISQ